MRVTSAESYESQAHTSPECLTQMFTSELAPSPFSSQLQRWQLLLLGRVAHAAEHSPLRASVFVGDGLDTQTGRYERRVGRPRLEWATAVMKDGERLLGKRVLESGCSTVRNMHL